MSEVGLFRNEGKFLLREDLRTASAASSLAFNEQIKELQESGKTIHHFGFGQSPFPAPQCFVRALQQWAHRTEYLPVKGLASLRQEIVKLHASEDGFELSADNLVVGPGSKELLYLTMAVSNAVALLPVPAWTTYAPQARMAGVKVVPLKTTSEHSYKLESETLEAAVKDLRDVQSVFLILTNPGNPSGTCYTQEELQSLSLVCKSRSIVVLSDEIYARLKFSGQHASILQHYPEGTILFSGFSKCASAGGWRLGYAHYPPGLAALKAAVVAAASQTYSCAPAPMQHAVAHSLRENFEELKNYFRDCRRVLDAVGRFCYSELTSVGLEAVPSEAGYYFILDFAPLRHKLRERGVVTGRQLSAALLEQANVGLMASSHFLMPDDDLSTRFCFICFDGAASLAALTRAQSQETLDDAFVRTHCLPVVEGVRAIKEWVLKL